MTGIYDYRLVALSVVVASIASYTALDLAGRVSSQRSGGASRLWFAGGALSMGAGIWSMHFIGMLAFSLPIPLAYDLRINALSWLAAVAVSGIALFVVRRPSLNGASLWAGAVLMGAGICVMHYTGMAAMRMSPPIQYDPALFAASVMIAIGASFAALWLAFLLKQRFSGAAVLAKLGSAAVMGSAIAGMHYTAMAAARFAPGSVCLAAGGSGGLDSAMLATLIGIATLGILAATLVVSALDAHFVARTAKLADSLQAANQQLRSIALHDALTQLPNRFLLDDRLAQAAFHADRCGKSFAIVFLDLDRFKQVNDTHGHGAGDEVLKEAARRLTGCLRREDTVARIGGDEFVLVLNEIVPPGGAEVVCRKVLAELARPFSIGALRLEISCSIGVSVYPQDGRDLCALMAAADAAMYRAKRTGRGRFQFFAPGMEASRAVR